MEVGLGFAEGFDKLYPADYMESLILLQACSASNQAAPISTFTAAVAMLNQGESVGAIHTKLATVSRFKAIIGEAPKQVSQLKIPIQPVLQNKQEKDGFIMLGKRGAANPTEAKEGPIDKFFLQPE